MDIIAALTLGLLGSLHCIGMCGPLVLAVPNAAEKRWKFFLERIVYNTGRAAMYGVIGAVLGLIGKSVLLGVQQDLSIVLGITILITVAVPLGFKSKLERFSPLKSIYAFVKQRFSALMKKRGMTSLFALGMLNGLLPCGLVYTALIGATVVADALQSGLFMIVFGAGTIPALVAVSLTGKLLSVRFRSLFARSVPIFSIALAVILILRGMNLGIPLLSPKVTHEVSQTETDVDCCE